MQGLEELGQRLSALRADFAALGTRAADAASALAAKLPPPPALLDELTGADEAFTELREAMLQHAGSLALDVDTERVGTLRDLEEVLTAIAAAEERQVQVHEWEEARDSVLQVLDQVMALVHREDRTFGALADCQARARELHGALAALAAEDLERETAEMSGKARPFRDLLALVDGWNVLDDDRCAFLQDALTQAFGRPLALAALRGKLAREGELPEPTRGRGVSREPAYPSGVYSPSGYAPPPAYPAVGYVPADDDATYPAAHATPAAETTHAGAAYAAAGASAPPAGISHPGLPPRPTTQMNSVDIRLSGDKIDVETPEARKDREKQLERLAQESAQWWISARNGWRAMRERGASFADAARDFLQRYPTLLSVPLPKSAEAGGRHVAEGYALLLAHIEKMEEGFVREALTRLNPQFTTGDGDKAYQLAQELYLYIVAEGRLYKTYPDFVRDVLVNALPASGPWVQGGLIEGDDATRRFMRGEEPGAREEHTDAVTGWQERIGPHVFTVSGAGPLTTRFFTLGLAGDALADPPDVEIKLKENDAATDHAWLLTLPMAGTTQPLAAKRHRTGGSTLTGLGREFGGLWIGLFNADPGSDRSYELSITLRRKPPAAAPKGMKAPAPSPTAGKFFGKR